MSPTDLTDAELELLSASLDEELAPEEQAALAALLERSAVARDELAALRQDLALLRGALPEPDEDAEALLANNKRRILSLLPDEPAPTPGWLEALLEWTAPRRWVGVGVPVALAVGLYLGGHVETPGLPPPGALAPPHAGPATDAGARPPPAASTHPSPAEPAPGLVARAAQGGDAPPPTTRRLAANKAQAIQEVTSSEGTLTTTLRLEEAGVDVVWMML